jgi:pimeloyl-ACP methyl ester carboxylesterase
VAAVVRIVVGEAELSFDVDGARLVPTDLGWDERPTAVVLGESARYREGLGPALARVAQVVYLDGRADGGLDVDDLRGFLDALEIERPVLVGGSIAVDFASRHPERVAKVVLAGGGADEAGYPVLAFADGDGLRAATDDVVAFVLEPEPEAAP